MKDLSMFQTVKTALEQVVAEADVKNGTTGMEILCHFWKQDYRYDEKRNSLQVEIVKAMLSSNLELVKLKQEEMDALPRPEIIMEFHLLEPIARIQGTKIISDGSKTMGISMENVSVLYIPENSIKLGLLDYEETQDKAKNAMGQEETIIKLHIKKGLIDVIPPVMDKNQKIVQPAKAYVTPISSRSLQIAGKILYKEREQKRRQYGFETIM